MSKRHKRNRSGLMGMSQIPYAQRIRIQQHYDIGWSREQGARITMYCFSIAAHEIEGVGLERLVRFNNRFQEVDDAFYGQEIEVSMAHARKRLADMGLAISGELMTAPPEPGCTVRQMEVKDNVVQAVQISLICGCIAANDVFGWAKVRLERIRARTEELTARYAKEGEGFLLEEMRKIGFTIADGKAVAFLKDGKPIRMQGAHFTRADGKGGNE